MKIEPERRRVLPDPVRQVPQGLVRLEGDDVGEGRVIGDERRHGTLGHEHELRAGMAPGHRPDERSRQEHIADGAEANEEDAQHAANVSLALPGFASRDYLKL